MKLILRQFNGLNLRGDSWRTGVFELRLGMYGSSKIYIFELRVIFN